MEHCDWIPAVLTGVIDVTKIKRSRCAAGHKAMWHELPPTDFLAKLDPRLVELHPRLFRETFTADVSCENLCDKWANRLGLTPSVKIAVDTFDAHAGLWARKSSRTPS